MKITCMHRVLLSLHSDASQVKCLDAMSKMYGSFFNMKSSSHFCEIHSNKWFIFNDYI